MFPMACHACLDCRWEGAAICLAVAAEETRLAYRDRDADGLCRLPCDSATGKLVYARAIDGSAWVPLMEKAVAKLGGSYAALHGGDIAWALRTLTGKPCSKYRFHETSGRWYRHEPVSSQHY